MRSIVFSSILIGLLLSGMVAPAIAESDPIKVGATDQAKVTFTRFTLVGMAVFGVVVTKVDGSVDDPIAAYIEQTKEKTPDTKEASAPDVGDASAMLITDSDDGSTVVVVVMLDDYFYLIAAAGMVLTLDEFLPLVDVVIDRAADAETLMERLPTLDDLPPGFTVDEESLVNADGTPIAQD